MSSFLKACVVGGGPAGLSAAIALKRISGCEVVMVDCAVPPVDKACGEGLMPDSIAALRQLDIDIPADAGFAFRGIRFTDGSSSVFADFPDGMARGIRRPVLHSLLVDCAAKQGIEMLWGVKQVRLESNGILANGRFVRADLVVGADGQNSSIRRQASLNRTKREKRRFGFRRHYHVAPWSPYVELHWAPHFQIYVTPVAHEEICVALISRDPHLRLDQALRECPELNTRLARALPVSPEMGALSVSRTLEHIQRENVVLIGDASGSVDAITGEGMCLGFRQSLALASAVRSQHVSNYERLHGAIMKRPRTMASLMMALDRNNQLQRRALAGLARHPELFQSLLSIHVGASTFRRLYSWRLLDFGRAFLAA